MSKRFLTLIALVLFLGFATRAFGQAAPGAPADARTFTRIEAVALLIESNPVLKERLAYYTKHLPPLSLYDDVDRSSWAAPYIETAFEAGLITGNAERVFRPNDILTEQEMITLAVRTYAIDHAGVHEEMAAHEKNWFNGAVMAALHNKLVLPFPIRASQPATGKNMYALMTSMGINNPQQIAISGLPRQAATTASVTQPIIRPVTTTAAPTTQSSPSAPIAQVSQKPFAISMPSLGVKDLTITHPSDPFTKDGLLAPLKYGVGHLFSYPGKGGTILVYGHSSSYPWDVSDYTKIFRQINKLAVGDRIEITYAGTLYTYEVTMKQTVPADDMTAYAGGNGEELILYTCWPPDSIKERYLVHAKPVKVAAR